MLLPRHLRCASHTLSLIATSDFMKAIKSLPVNRLHLGAMEKCNFLWNMSRRPKSAEVIKSILGCSLIYPCPTRWNSLFDSISQLLTYKEKLNTVFEHLNTINTNYVFKDLDIEYLDDFVILLKPIACALDYLQGEINCYYGVLIPTLFSLKHRLESLKEKQLRHLSSMISPLILSLSNRFDFFLNLAPEANHAILATCFHPTFKLRWVPEMTTDREKKRIQNLCINEIDCSAKQNSSEIESHSSEESEESFIIFSSEPDQFRQQSSNELEFISFLNDKNKSLSCLDNYPKIKKLFIKYNTSLTSSASVERLFSFAGLIHSPCRSSMSDDTFKKLVSLKGNQEFISKHGI